MDLPIVVGVDGSEPSTRAVDRAADEPPCEARHYGSRGRGTGVAGLEPLLRPEVVAVVGAGRKPGSVGRAILHHLKAGGYTRRIFAVNPNASHILGVPSYPSVSALPRTPGCSPTTTSADCRWSTRTRRSSASSPRPT